MSGPTNELELPLMQGFLSCINFSLTVTFNSGDGQVSWLELQVIFFCTEI